MVRSAMVLSTEWAQVEVVELTNDGNGLGFNLVGGRSTGVVIKYVLPGGTADKDGRLQSGDHVLQIGSVNLRGFTSEQVAAVLRQAGPAVRLLVARPADPAAALRAPIPGTALVPTKILADPELLDRHLIESGYGAVYDISQCYTEYINGQNGDAENIVAAAVSVVGENPQQIPEYPLVAQAVSPTITITVPVELPQLPEVEIVHVDLNKNVYGLGITVAGYVCEKEELSGIFVKSIIEGSSAEQSGKIRINDRIIEVDGVSLAEKSNPQAVEILRNTGISVHLVLERYLRGPKYEHLQLAIFNEEKPSSPTSSTTTLSWFPVPSQVENSVTEIEPEAESNTTIDSSVLEVGEAEVNEPTQEELDRRFDEILAVTEEEVTKKWESEIGTEKQIIIAEVHKLEGLGISLEGTVDVEGGQEVRPHHYIRSVLPDGPVGQQGTLIAGDELLEANEYRLHGLTHTEVVNILKHLPNRVRLVCARSTESGPRPLINLAPDREGFEARKIISGSLNNLTTLVKAQSDTSINTSSTATLTNHSGHSRKSRSLECVSGLAMWQSREDIVQLVKADQGLGFSILDYQDPIDPQGTVIVVRSLVPGGVAEKNGEISPGDRVMSVNGVSIKNATLDQAVQALKGAPRGVVRVGIARPLPPHDSKSKSTTTLNTKPS
ncbi:patj homolog [Galleria mellonella]|uniref:Patj homolog n=1 Tax=Galleria mellonella TaxID=7137 RepID=A0A6J1X877_GALME|nr:patj homolog [Galleria mellonella]